MNLSVNLEGKCTGYNSISPPGFENLRTAVTLHSFLPSAGNIIGEELKNSKQVRDIENKLSNVREMLLNHDETFGEILESLSLNQLAVSALKEYLTSES